MSPYKIAFDKPLRNIERSIRRTVFYVNEVIVNLFLEYTFQLSSAFVAFIPVQVNAVNLKTVAFNQKIAAMETICVLAFITGNVAAVYVF